MKNDVYVSHPQFPYTTIMRNTTCFLALFGCFGLVRADHGKNILRSSEHHQNMAKSIKQKERMLSLSTMMMPGNRVSAMDRGSAICTAEYNSDQEVAITRTVIDYYYAIESTKNVTTDNSAGRSMIRMLEDKLFRAIRPAILWCYFDELPLTRRDLLGIDSSLIQGMVITLQIVQAGSSIFLYSNVLTAGFSLIFWKKATPFEN